MTYKREPKIDLVEKVKTLEELWRTAVEFGLDGDHFLDWLEVKFQEYVAEFAPVSFNESKREFGDDMPRAAKKVVIEGETAPMLMEWQQLTPKLAEIKDREHALRQTLVMRLFDAEKLEGTQTIDIGQGWKLRSSKSQNVSVANVKDKMDALCAAIWQIEEIQSIAMRLFIWSPGVSTPAYRELVEASEKYPALKTMMAALFTVKPGMPELEIIPPKESIPVETEQQTVAGTVTTDGSNIKW